MPMQSTAWYRLVQFGFRLLYHELAFTYDWVSWAVSLGQWRCWQRAALDFLPPSGSDPILELAHGTGDLQLDLHAAGYRSIGYDLSSQMGQIANRKLRSINPRLVRGYAQQLPFARSVFAAVVCTFPTSFILADETLAAVYRVLCPGGRLVVVPSARLTGSGVVAHGVEWLYAVTGQRASNGSDFTESVRRAGFDVSTEQVMCSGSLVMVVIAEKPNFGSRQDT